MCVTAKRSLTTVARTPVRYRASPQAGYRCARTRTGSNCAPSCRRFLSLLVALGALAFSTGFALAEESAPSSAELPLETVSIVDHQGPNLQPRIVGGEQAGGEQWPFMVAILRASGSTGAFQRQFCGGSVIASRWVLTAAHCLFSRNGVQIAPESIRVAVGRANLDEIAAEDEVIVTNIIVNPGYMPGSEELFNADIALLEVATPLGVTPIPLSSYDPELLAAQSAQGAVIGWGLLSDPELDPAAASPLNLRYTLVPLVPQDICNQPVSYNGDIGADQLCAGFAQGGRDSCAGDSGGPLVVRVDDIEQQIGVVSFGAGCARPNFFGVYSNVPFYTEWIAELVPSVNITSRNVSDPIAVQSPSPRSSGGGAIQVFFWVGMLLVRLGRRVHHAN